jgi:hypothetical protein
MTEKEQRERLEMLELIFRYGNASKYWEELCRSQGDRCRKLEEEKKETEQDLSTLKTALGLESYCYLHKATSEIERLQKVDVMAKEAMDDGK